MRDWLATMYPKNTASSRALLLVLAVLLPLTGALPVAKAEFQSPFEFKSSPKSTDRHLGVGFMGRVRSLDPLQTSSPIERTLVALLLDGLYEYMPNGSILPRVATDFPTWEDDLTVLIPVREGLLFHNGETLTPADVVFTLRRLITEGKRYRKDELYSALASADEAPGHAVRLRLHYPVHNLIELLTRIETFPVSRKEALASGERFGQVSLSGVGPFQLEAVTPGLVYTVSRNPRYWLSFSDRNRLAAAQEVRVSPRSVESATTSEAAPPTATPRSSGLLDELKSTPIPESKRLYLPLMSKVTLRRFDSHQDLGEAAEKQRLSVAFGYEPSRAGGLWSYGVSPKETHGSNRAQLYLNGGSSPLHEEQVRRALLVAFDRPAVARVGYRTLGEGARGFLPGLPTRILLRDTNEARELLELAGYTQQSPLELTLHYTDTGELRRMAMTLERQAQDLPLRLYPIPVSKAELLDRLYRRNGHGPDDFQLALEDWQDFRGGFDARTWLRENLYSASAQCKTTLGDTELDGLIECLDLQATRADYLAHLARIEEHLRQTVPLIPLAVEQIQWAQGSQTQDVYWNPMGWLHLKDGWQY